MYQISGTFALDDPQHRQIAWEWLKGVLMLCWLDDTYDQWEIAEVEENETINKVYYKFTRPKEEDGTR